MKLIVSSLRIFLVTSCVWQRAFSSQSVFQWQWCRYSFLTAMLCAYLVSLSISKESANKFHLNYDFQFSDKNMFFDLVYVHDKPDSSFFSIYMNDMLVGHGHCWGMQCHTNWSYHGHNIEHTLQNAGRRSGAIHGMGSKRGKNGMVYIWKEMLRPIN